ncbi:MAG: beta-N-acetylhexosaminidase [Sneathiella sp.]
MQKTDLSHVKSVIFSCVGLKVTEAEREFFEQENPFGFILFARNVDNPDQLKKLTDDLRGAVGRPDAPVLVDQEGGRVLRLKAPHWFEAPAFGKLGKLFEKNSEQGIQATRLATRLIARDLTAAGINVDCSPCLDLSFEETSSVIGDRSFNSDPARVAILGAVVAEEFLNAGIIPVIKHVPGHGRAIVDSHHHLPTVSATREELIKTDFDPFQALNKSPWGMTAHIVFDAIDPDRPATQSGQIINEIIRGDIGFDGLLLTDDLNMQALEGPLDLRASRALEAGVDIILHCSGKIDEMKLVAGACPKLSDASIDRILRAEKQCNVISPPLYDQHSMIKELNSLLSKVEDA